MKEYQAEIAEKKLLSSQELETTNHFKLGGKIFFEDLSVLKYINNLNFIEVQKPQGFLKSEFFVVSSDKETDNSKELLSLITTQNTKGHVKIPVLRLVCSPKDMAEGDHKDILVFHNGESAFQSFDGFDYTLYDKNDTKKLLNTNFNIDSNLLIKKMQNDIVIEEKIEPKQENKSRWRLFR